MDLKFQLLILITLLGIINTLYLSYHAIRGTLVACIGFPDEWCEKVQKSKYSKTFGIPNPYLGLGMLIVILILIFLTLNGTVPFWMAGAVISFGFAFSVYFLYIQAAIIKAFCTWCVVSFIVFLLLFIITLAIGF
jgi:uncharacterized membrane protein